MPASTPPLRRHCWARGHARHPLGRRPAAGVHGRAGRARRLGGAARLRRAARSWGPSSSTARACTTCRASSAPSSGPCAMPARTSASPRPTSAGSLRCWSEQSPRVMATAAAPPDADGWCSLSLHAGGTIAELQRGRGRPGPPAGGRGLGALPARPSGSRRSTRTRSTWTRSTCWSRATPRRSRSRPSAPTDVDSAIADHAARFIPDGRDPPDRHRLDPLDDRRGSWPRARAATTASTRRCSPTA